VLARAYAAVPIGVTVEGSNILTRSLIIYGQGAVRCHPWLRREIAAVETGDISAFERAACGHAGFVLRGIARAFALGLTNGRLARSPVSGPLGILVRRLTRTSAAFALVSEVTMLTLGSTLKRREKITGRLADALAWMYLGSAAVKRFHDEGQPPGDLPFVRWAGFTALAEAQRALAGVLDNLPNRPAAWCVRRLVFPLGGLAPDPDDALGATVARALLDDPAARSRLTRDIYLPHTDEPGLGRLEAALAKVAAAAPVAATLRDAVRGGRLEALPAATLAARAQVSGHITEAEAKTLDAAEAAREDAIQVDAFDDATYRRLRG
jgi:acyl-CoA dehydrogenase